MCSIRSCQSALRFVPFLISIWTFIYTTFQIHTLHSSCLCQCLWTHTFRYNDFVIINCSHIYGWFAWMWFSCTQYWCVRIVFLSTYSIKVFFEPQFMPADGIDCAMSKYLKQEKYGDFPFSAAMFSFMHILLRLFHQLNSLHFFFPLFLVLARFPICFQCFVWHIVIFIDRFHVTRNSNLFQRRHYFK